MIIYDSINNNNNYSISNLHQFNNTSTTTTTTTLEEKKSQTLSKHTLTTRNQQFLKSIGLTLKKH